MTQTSWMTWVLLVGLLWLSPIYTGKGNKCKDKCPKIHWCFNKNKNQTIFIVADNFNGFIKNKDHLNLASNQCIIFLQKNATNQQHCTKKWPQISNTSDSLYILKWHIKKERHLCVLKGKCKNVTGRSVATKKASADEATTDKPSVGESCQAVCFCTQTVCKKSIYDEDSCHGLRAKNKYIVNLSGTNTICSNCNNPVKKPELSLLFEALEAQEEPTDPAQAVEVMNNMTNLATTINTSSAALSFGNGVTGILVKQTIEEDVDEVSFAYTSPNNEMSIMEDKENLAKFSRSVSLSKEAFEKAIIMNVSVPFVAVLRFNNLAKDALNSTVLGNEVLAVEMGAAITNLTDKISIVFRNMKYKGSPTCQSWNGEGSRPNWTDDGCETIEDGNNITCLCSHLTFFAILLAPLNETISSSDLKSLTMISQIGCGLSMFFLSIVLFMHFLIRKTKANKAARILIQLVTAMFLLNFTFLINSFVANSKSSMGCKIMAALMHYFMLATFTWFAVQAFHLCLQLYTLGKISIRHYILKVSITSWVLPCVVGIVLLSLGTYGEQIIHTDNIEDNVAMCWITESHVHYIVNIGYYVLIFLFTFTTFVIILSWLVCLRRHKTGNKQTSRDGKSIVTVLGLCCMLGITWGFAFFAYGVLRIPSYYIFTVLNSFQGFFLFIYYYNTHHSGDLSHGASKNATSTSTSTTLKTSLDTSENPYTMEAGKK